MVLKYGHFSLKPGRAGRGARKALERMRQSLFAATYYEASAHPHASFPALVGDVSADVVVVGGGFTGVSAALELAEAGYKVVLLEAGRIGSGASGRNGGQICTGFSPGQARLETQVSHADALKCFALAEEAKLLIEERIAENFVVWHRKEAVERMKMAESMLGMTGIFPPCPTYHLWLHLPAPWRANEFAAHVRLGNTLVSPADVFAVDRNPAPHAVRVSLGGVAERSRLADYASEHL